MASMPLNIEVAVWKDLNPSMERIYFHSVKIAAERQLFLCNKRGSIPVTNKIKEKRRLTLLKSI
jgi:hypothetical protein